MALKFDPKDTRDSTDHQFEWVDYLDADETIDTFEVTCADADLVISAMSKAPSKTGVVDKSVTFFASGGVAGTTYEITCEITTTAGKTVNRKAKLPVKDL